MHLAKCLENDDWDGIRKDFDKRPAKGIDGSASKEQLTQVLKDFGIYIDESKLTDDAQPIANCQLPTVLTLWGTGNPKREFLYVEDMADACVFLLENLDAKELYYSGITHINIGSGRDLSIKEVALTVKKVIGYQGEVVFASSKPDGTMQKLLDVARLHKLGWENKIDLAEGIKRDYDWYNEQIR